MSFQSLHAIVDELKIKKSTLELYGIEKTFPDITLDEYIKIKESCTHTTSLSVTEPSEPLLTSELYSEDLLSSQKDEITRYELGKNHEHQQIHDDLFFAANFPNTVVAPSSPVEPTAPSEYSESFLESVLLLTSEFSDADSLLHSTQ